MGKILLNKYKITIWMSILEKYKTAKHVKDFAKLRVSFFSKWEKFIFPPYQFNVSFWIVHSCYLKKKCIQQFILYINIYNIHQIESTKKMFKEATYYKINSLIHWNTHIVSLFLNNVLRCLIAGCPYEFTFTQNKAVTCFYF